MTGASLADAKRGRKGPADLRSRAARFGTVMSISTLAVRRVGWKGPSLRLLELIMPTNTVRLHRVLRSTPDRIYRAFLDAPALAKWLPPNGFTGTVHHLQAEVGGSYRMSFTNFTTGDGHSFGGEYLELVPHQRIRYTGKFDDPNLPGEMQTTVSLAQTPFGTEVNIVQEGIPEVIPVQACYLGWQESLALLKQLVEAEIRQ
jgi:uncharacterized protein YndB with AHSA1/START domain